MIKSVTITNYLGENIRLELTEPGNTGFYIKSIDGLGPVKANINTSNRAATDGGIYNSSYLDQRNIVLNLGYMQTDYETIEQVRQKSYKYFPIKRSVKIKIETDNRVAEAEGYIESNEPNIFSKESDCTISIICPDPYLYSPYPNVIRFYGIEPLFEFPFSNESIEEPLLPVGLIKDMDEENVYYEGDSEVGMSIMIHVLDTPGDITIRYKNTDEKLVIIDDRMLLFTGSRILKGDTIRINTMRGHKSVMLTRNGVKTNIINCLDKNSKWFTLSKGDNIFSYETSMDGEIEVYIESKVAYDGV